jgi:hypothetical protein
MEMEAGYVWDGIPARTERVVTEAPSLGVVTWPEVNASPNEDLVGGIVRFGLNSSRRSVDLDCAGGIVRFGFGSQGH